jgi:AbrB family looped-hinge helix DNA binding protein
MVICIKKMGKRGEVVIPREIREEKGLGPDTRVEIISTKNAILLIPLENSLSDLAGLFGNKGVGDIEELDAIMHEILGTM